MPEQNATTEDGEFEARLMKVQFSLTQSVFAKGVFRLFFSGVVV